MSNNALKALPDSVYRETVERLTAGQKVRVVARWLLTQNRGMLQHEPIYIVRKHVAELKFYIAAHEQGPADSATTPIPLLPTKQSACQVVPSPQDAKLRELQDVSANAPVENKNQARPETSATGQTNRAGATPLGAPCSRVVKSRGRRKDMGRLHAVRHAVLSRYPLEALRHLGEDPKSLRRLERRFRAELKPQGAIAEVVFYRFWSNQQFCQ